MRRLSRRLSERTPLKSVASLLVGVGLAAGMVTAHGGSLLAPGTTTYKYDSELRSDTPLEIGAEHTVILDTSHAFVMLDAPLVNHGVVRWASAGFAEDTPPVVGASERTQVNRGQWIIEDNLMLIMAGAFDNQGGAVLIGKNSELLISSQAFVGGRVHGESDTSLLSGVGLKDATITGQVNLRSSWMEPKPVALAGTLTVDGVLQINSVALSESTLLRGTGRTVLNNATIGAETGVIAPQLTVGSGQTLSGTGRISDVMLINQGTLENQQRELLVSNKAIVQQGVNAQIVVNGHLDTPSIELQGGTIDLGYTGLVNGDVAVQEGRLVLHDFVDFDRDFGKLGAAISGNLTLSEHSQLEVMADRGFSHFSILEVWGAASLDGELVLSFLEGTRLPSTFEMIFSANSLQGSFRSLRVNGAGNLPWKFVQERVSDTQLTVTITAVPEPSTWGLMLCGLGLVGWRLRRRVATQTAH